jgi:hypothetical protein
MERLIRRISAAFVGVGALVLFAYPAGAQGTRSSALRADRLQARVVSGSISGSVIDESGASLRGAMVSAVGVTLASTVTDEHGQFTLNQLPVGKYLLRAHMLGFAASPASVVRVNGSTAFQRVQLRRLAARVVTPIAPAAAAAVDADAPVTTRPIIAAGFDLPGGADAESTATSATAENHPHDEAAWRLRHLKRSILKDAAPIVVLTDDDAVVPTGSLFGRAMGSAASIASSIFTDFPFSGEVNFLTTGAVAPGAVLSATALPRGVAYLALAAPGAGGDWTIRAAMSEGDLSSWIVAGAYASKPGAAHSYDMGLSYSTQEYLGGNPAALAAVTDGSRNVGELYAFDRWTVNPTLTLDYGARYAHYDYLQQRGMLSPRFAVTLEPLRDIRVTASVSQRMVVPGAEEFLATGTPGPWLPPERTFAPLDEPGDATAFRAERSRSYEAGIEREFSRAFVLGVSRFQQSVDDQLLTVFGLRMPGGPSSVGHYYVASVGGLATDGWTVRWNTAPRSPVQGSIQYSRTHARWAGGASELVRSLVPAAVRANGEELHDLSTSFSADIRETATRVYLLYKVNNGFVRPGSGPSQAGLDMRFGLQVNQALPVAFAGTKWEVLVGLRNLFRDPTDPASVYDELLVVRPPKRLVGGFLVRF